MSKQDSSKTVFLALSVNFFIGVIKSFVAVITSSSAMFSEAVHSFVDSFNQFLLWFGIKQSKKSNPKVYPLGRGKEEYFWTLVVAVLIFTIGGLVSLEHGIEALSHPKKLENLFISLHQNNNTIDIEASSKNRKVVIYSTSSAPCSDNFLEIPQAIDLSFATPMIKPFLPFNKDIFLIYFFK